MFEDVRARESLESSVQLSRTKNDESELARAVLALCKTLHVRAFLFLLATAKKSRLHYQRFPRRSSSLEQAKHKQAKHPEGTGVFRLICNCCPRKTQGIT